MTPRNSTDNSRTRPTADEDCAPWNAVEVCLLTTSVDAATTPSELQGRFSKGLHSRVGGDGTTSLVYCWLTNSQYMETSFSFDKPNRLVAISSSLNCASQQTAEAALAQSSLALRRTVPWLHVHHPKIVTANRRRPGSATVSWRFGRHETITIEARQQIVGAKVWTLTILRAFEQPDALARCHRSSLDHLFT